MKIETIILENRKENRMINEIDTKILNIIQQDARISNAEIARQVGLAPSAFWSACASWKSAA
jgi:hypothetical protein